MGLKKRKPTKDGSIEGTATLVALRAHSLAGAYHLL
jgi:hypothetical protein